jgi:uncharacterized protein
VAGIGPGIAKNIVEHRKNKGLFKERGQLKDVSQFSSKTFEQAAGFLRISGGDFPLDATGIHPERYSAVKEMASEAGLTVSKLMGSGATALKEKRDKWVELVGEFTFDDIVEELEKPGRDPRDPYQIFQYREDVNEIKDLKKDMICPGIVTNVTNFGAFVDVGVHQDGLVHISEISNQFVSDPAGIVSPGDQVKVRVLGVDTDKSQISLSMRLNPEEKVARKKPAGKSQGGPRKAKGKDGGGSRKGKGPGKGKPRGGKGGGKGGPQRPPRKPFNNPFAALSDINKDG